MILKKIDIENFRCFDQLTINLNSRINIILGNNGGGKTAILDAISIGLGSISTHLPDVSGISLKKTDLKVSHGEAKPYSRIEIEIDNGIRWDRMLRRDKSKLTSKLLPPLLGTKELLNFLDEDIIDRYNAKKNFELPLYVYYGVSRAILDIPLTRKGFKKEPSRFESLNESLKSMSRFKKAFVWFYNKENEENRLQKEKRDFDVTLKELDVVRDAIVKMFPGLSEPHIEINPLRFMIKKEGESLSLDQFSDGYKTMLGLIIDLSARLVVANPHLDNPLEAESIVMIDEIDLHLHPSWQEKVINDLLRTFPKTQFIFTTHSPYIIESLNNNLKKYKIENKIEKNNSDQELNEIVSLNPQSTKAYMLDKGKLVNILDENLGLIDDKLLSNLNSINRTYDKMRDIEWAELDD